jgi:hypothetical protein
VRTTRAGIVDYFTNFLKLSPQGKVDQSQIRLLSPTLALHSGVYSFTLEDEGKLKIVQVGDPVNNSGAPHSSSLLCGFLYWDWLSLSACVFQ